MKFITLISMLLILTGSAFAGDCGHDDCDCATPCDDCTCDGTANGCSGDCCDCDAEDCDEECSSDNCTCETHEIVETVEEPHCGECSGS